MKRVRSWGLVRTLRCGMGSVSDRHLKEEEGPLCFYGVRKEEGASLPLLDAVLFPSGA